jgi:hypothetical protein
MKHGESMYDLPVFTDLRKNTLLEHLTLVKLFTDVAKPEHPEKCELAHAAITDLKNYIIGTSETDYSQHFVKQSINKIKAILEIDDIVFYTMYYNLA